MSAHASREDFWQATAKSTIKERCKAIFNQELLSDVKFIVRDSQSERESRKTIPAHKFVLAINSEVFFAMFYGELPETKDSVEISECEYESVLELFRFMYSDEANLKPNNVMDVLYLAKKYMLPSLAHKCSVFLQENLDASSVFYVLSDAKRYEEKDLVAHCWKVIEKETGEAVISDGFATVERSILEELVKNDSLNISELALFKAIHYWAEKACEKQGVAAVGSVKRRILGERVVKGIRFPRMTKKEFSDVVLDCDILTQDETNCVIKYLNSVLKVPVGFSNKRRAGHRNVLSRFRSLNFGWSCCRERPEAILIKVDKSINFHAMRFFGNESFKFVVNMKVKILRGNDLANVTGTFFSKLIRSELGDYRGFEMVLDPPVVLKPNLQYIFNAVISGPTCWYGEGGLSVKAHSGVKFEFVMCRTDSFGSPTCVEAGQFSEFVFTVI